MPERLCANSGTVRAAEREKTTADASKMLRAGRASEPWHRTFDGQAETNIEHLGTKSHKRIQIQRHVASMSTLGV